MTASCNKVAGSDVKAYIVPNPLCLDAPVIHQIALDAAVPINATSISIKLDSTFTPTSGAYTANSSYALYPGTLLYFVVGAVTTVVEVLESATPYDIKLAASTVKVRRVRTPIAIAGIAQTLFAAPLCTQKFDVTASNTSQDNTTNCTGRQSTMTYTAFGEKISASGFPNGRDRSFWALQAIGDVQGTAFVMVDYAQQYHRVLVAEIGKLTITNSQAKNLVGYTMEGEVQLSVESYPGVAAIEAALIPLAQAERSLYGAILGKY